MHIGYLEDSKYDHDLSGYSVIDLDSFDCAKPFVDVIAYAAKPHDTKIDQIKLTHRGEKKIIKFPSVWVILLVMDPSQRLI